MTLKQLTESYRVVHFWWDGLYNAVWRNVGRIQSGQVDHDTKMAIDRKLHEIKELVEGVYCQKIGKQTMYEIRLKKGQ